MMSKLFMVQGITPEHSRYLKKRKRRSILILICQIFIAFFFFVGWEIAAKKGWIDPLLFSKPSSILALAAELWQQGELLHHILTTVMETLVGFTLGTIVGTAIAIIIWASPFLSRVLDPYMVILNGMPKVALGPLFIVSFGGGYAAIIAMALAISVIITTIVIHASFKEVDTNYIKLALTFGAKKWQVFYKIIFPASFPTIISTLKVNVGLAWIGVIVGEFLVSKQGLGYLIIYGFQVFNFTMVMMSLLIIAILATIMYEGVRWLEKAIIGNRK
jgi:NitT/TauT family transport system permease protein